MYALTVLSFLSLLLETPVPKATDPCNWIEKSVTVYGFTVDYVWIAPNVLAYTCTGTGQKSGRGRYVFIQNKGQTPFYYRASPSSQYSNAANRKALWITSSNTFYYELAPLTSRIVDCSGYESQLEKTLPTEAVLQIKFCQTSNQTAAGQSADPTISSAPSDDALTFTTGDLVMGTGQEAYAFINYNCGRQRIYYVSDVFRYAIGKDPEAQKKSLLKRYWDVIKERTSRQDDFDALTGSTSRECVLYFEGGRVPLSRTDALEIRDEVIKPLERDGIRVHTVKIQQ